MQQKRRVNGVVIVEALPARIDASAERVGNGFRQPVFAVTICGEGQCTAPEERDLILGPITWSSLSEGASVYRLTSSVFCQLLTTPAALQGAPATQKGCGIRLWIFSETGSMRVTGIMLFGNGSVTIWPSGAICRVAGS